jgi:hypothetical protein
VHRAWSQLNVDLQMMMKQMEYSDSSAMLDESGTRSHQCITSPLPVSCNITRLLRIALSCYFQKVDYCIVDSFLLTCFSPLVDGAIVISRLLARHDTHIG